MTTAEMAAYACDQIDQARTELNAVSKRRPGLSLFQRELAQIGVAVAEQLGTAG